MPKRESLPKSASVANPHSDGRLIASSATRNFALILALAKRVAPESGKALEIASGTGQHIES